jgi:hypothetical protein
VDFFVEMCYNVIPWHLQRGEIVIRLKIDYYQAVANYIAKKSGVQHIEYFSESKAWCAFYNFAWIHVPKPVNRRTLFVFMHECGHIYLDANKEYRCMLVHFQEYLAHQFAINHFRKLGIPVPKDILVEIKTTMAERILKRESDNLYVCPTVRQWCKKYRSAAYHDNSRS